MEFIQNIVEEFNVGEETFIETVSILNEHFHVIFEDDKNTGYIYILDLKEKDKENPIKDALHIYNVEDVVDKHIPSEIEFLWSEDGNICMFLINKYPHAVINYKEKYGFCRTGFPPKDEKSAWSKNGHDWDKEIFNKLIDQ